MFTILTTLHTISIVSGIRLHRKCLDYFLSYDVKRGLRTIRTISILIYNSVIISNIYKNIPQLNNYEIV